MSTFKVPFTRSIEFHYQIIPQRHIEVTNEHKGFDINLSLTNEEDSNGMISLHHACMNCSMAVVMV